jgi:plasmid maintenance system antidote protein VapI
MLWLALKNQPGDHAAMNFQDLHELLRVELQHRIDRGALTGSRLAQQAGFQQAHISNFLNRKRALSLDGLDRVLASQNLTIDQLIPLDLHADTTTSRSHPTHTPQQDLTDIIPVVSPSAAMDDARIAPAAVIETIHVSASRLHDNRARPATRYAQWQRFLAIRADAQQAAAMDPLITPGAIAVLDRHYNSLAPYRAHHPNLYAIRCGAGLLLRFVDFDEGRLILRPYVRNFPVQLLPLLHHETPADYIVGRVCLIFSEL